jgi:hypothetical protein
MATEETKYKVGDEEVTLDELIKGYMRQADYTRKRQADAEEIRRQKEELRAIQAEADRAARWDQWYEANRERIENTMKNRNEATGIAAVNEYTGFENDEDHEIKRLRDEISQLSKTIKDLKDAGEKEINAIALENQKLSRALRYSLDLDALKDRHLRERPDIPFDRERLINQAFDYNKPDLSRADWEMIYNQAYKDEFIKRDVDRQVAERLKAEEEKLKATKMAETGEFIKPFEVPKEIPTDTATVTGDVLKILHEEKAKRGE